MTYEFLKVIAQPVLLERDEHGQVTGEKLGEPTVLYNRDQLFKFLEELDQAILNENVRLKEEPDAGSGGNGSTDFLRQSGVPR